MPSKKLKALIRVAQKLSLGKDLAQVGGQSLAKQTKPQEKPLGWKPQELNPSQKPLAR